MAGKWKETSLSAVMDVKHGFAFPGKNIRDEPPGDILLTPGNFAIGGGFKGDKFKYFDGDVPDEYVLNEGELLVTMTDLSKEADTLGYPALVPVTHGSRFLHNQRLGKVVIKPSAQLDKLFLFYLLRTDEYRHEVLASATGTTVKHTSPGRILAHKTTIPPLIDQQAIACILGALDDKIELNRVMSRTLEATARAIFKSWFVDFDPVRAKAAGQQPPGLKPEIAVLFPDSFEDSELGEIPKGWKIGCVGELAEVSSGKRPDARFAERSDEASVPLWGGNGPMAFVRKPLFNEPILLTGRVGTLGSVFRITDPCWPSDNTLILRANEPSVFEYLFLQLHQVNFASLNRGSTQPLLTQTDLKAQRLVVPMKNMLEIFSRIANSMYCRFDESTAEIRTLSALRDASLSKLISGELRVPDAERIAARCV
jgi:type I restriction enzyme, S subunit